MLRNWTTREQIEQNIRVDMGWQCPDCFSVRIGTEPRQPHDPYRFQCQECGCQWSRKVY